MRRGVHCLLCVSRVAMAWTLGPCLLPCQRVTGDAGSLLAAEDRRTGSAASAAVGATQGSGVVALCGGTTGVLCVSEGTSLGHVCVRPSPGTGPGRRCGRRGQAPQVWELTAAR